MRRPIWSGSISFGLVNVPVKLYSATSPKEVRFHMLHDKDGGRIQQKRVCSIDGHEVPWEHIVKGFEVSKGRYVSVTREELSAFDPKGTRSIDIEDFAELSQIDPIYYESTYYLLPDKGAQKPYALLLEAMRKTGRVGVARFVLRTKQYLAAVRPLGKALAISTMLYADEVVDQSELDGLPGSEAKPREKELHMAEQLVGRLRTPWPDRLTPKSRSEESVSSFRTSTRSSPRRRGSPRRRLSTTTCASRKRSCPICATGRSRSSGIRTASISRTSTRRTAPRTARPGSGRRRSTARATAGPCSSAW